MGSPLLWFDDGVKFLRNILRFADEQGELKAIDQSNNDKNALIYIDPTCVGLYVLDDSDSALDARIELQDNGNITQKGAIILFSKDYAANETALVGGYSKHVFTSVPAGNVVVTTALNGAEFTLANESGSNFTIEGNTTETFNGAATFVIEDGQNYKFIEAGYGEYTILQKSVPVEGIPSGGTTGQVLTKDSNTDYDAVWETPSTPAPAVGTVVQKQYYPFTGVATGTTSIPNDDTIPQSSEGDQYMTADFTPTKSTNSIIIYCSFMGSASALATLTMALFKDSDANAMSATLQSNAANYRTTITLIHGMATAGTTSQITFKVRVGMDGAGTTTFNGVAGGRYFGGVAGSGILIEEIER